MSLKERRSGHATGMAGEFFVMEKLYRLGHQPALTMGNAKSIDILVRTATGKVREISVKAIRGGGKWGIDGDDVSRRANLIYVLLHYHDFEEPTAAPDVFVVPARAAEAMKDRWFEGWAIYCSNPDHRKKLERFRDAWASIS